MAKHRRATWRARWARMGAVGTLVAAIAAVSTGAASAAVTDSFELDGNIVDNSGASTSPPDWQSVFTNPGNASPVPTAAASLPSPVTNAFFFRDFTPGGTDDATTFTTGAKDTYNPSGPGANNWQCASSSNVTDKGDIQNTYMAVARVNGHTVVYAGIEKNAPNGDNNVGVWLLQDGNVKCTSGKSATTFTGNHVDGDVLLVAAFASGGTSPSISAYRWNGGAGGSLGQTAIGTGGKCGVAGSENLCAITNDTSAISTFWQTQNKGSATSRNKTGLGTSLDADQFYEMGADLSQLGLNECFANYLADTRSATSPTATLYDYAGGSAPICGSLTVSKYIDVDKSGGKNTGDVTSGTAVSGWSFTVTDQNDNVVCSGTTGSDGKLVCTTGSLQNMQPGTYTVTETQQTGYFATDPGGSGTFNTSSAPSKTVTVTTSGGSLDFGNTCFVNKTFQVTGVPTGTAAPTSITAAWTKNSGDGTASSGTVPLTDAGNGHTGDGIWQGTLSNALAQDANITWSWYINGDTTHTASGATNESLSDGAYPTCSVVNTVQFSPATLSGTKYKDVNHNGAFDSGTDLAGAGFAFQLLRGTTVVSTAYSDSSGDYSFSNVFPGTYTVHEVPVTGWVQTQPANGADRTVTVNLGDTSVTIDAFGNTPLSSLGLTFTPQAKLPGTNTDATNGTITCVDSSNHTAGGPQSGNSYSASNVYIGTYTCTVTITDP